MVKLRSILIGRFPPISMVEVGTAFGTVGFSTATSVVTTLGSAANTAVSLSNNNIGVPVSTAGPVSVPSVRQNAVSVFVNNTPPEEKVVRQGRLRPRPQTPKPSRLAKTLKLVNNIIFWHACISAAAALIYRLYKQFSTPTVDEGITPVEMQDGGTRTLIPINSKDDNLLVKFVKASLNAYDPINTFYKLVDQIENLGTKLSDAVGTSEWQKMGKQIAGAGLVEFLGSFAGSTLNSSLPNDGAYSDAKGKLFNLERVLAAISNRKGLDLRLEGSGSSPSFSFLDKSEFYDELSKTEINISDRTTFLDFFNTSYGTQEVQIGGKKTKFMGLKASFKNGRIFVEILSDGFIGQKLKEYKNSKKDVPNKISLLLPTGFCEADTSKLIDQSLLGIIDEEAQKKLTNLNKVRNSECEEGACGAVRFEVGLNNPPANKCVDVKFEMELYPFPQVHSINKDIKAGESPTDILSLIYHNDDTRSSLANDYVASRITPMITGLLLPDPGNEVESISKFFGNTIFTEAKLNEYKNLINSGGIAPLVKIESNSFEGNCSVSVTEKQSGTLDVLNQTFDYFGQTQQEAESERDFNLNNMRDGWIGNGYTPRYVKILDKTISNISNTATVLGDIFTRSSVGYTGAASLLNGLITQKQLSTSDFGEGRFNYYTGNYQLAGLTSEDIGGFIEETPIGAFVGTGPTEEAATSAASSSFSSYATANPSINLINVSESLETTSCSSSSVSSSSVSSSSASCSCKTFQITYHVEVKRTPVYTSGPSCFGSELTATVGPYTATLTQDNNCLNGSSEWRGFTAGGSEIILSSNGQLSINDSSDTIFRADATAAGFYFFGFDTLNPIVYEHNLSSPATNTISINPPNIDDLNYHLWYGASTVSAGSTEYQDECRRVIHVGIGEMTCTPTSSSSSSSQSSDSCSSLSFDIIIEGPMSTPDFLPFSTFPVVLASSNFGTYVDYNNPQAVVFNNETDAQQAADNLANDPEIFNRTFRAFLAANNIDCPENSFNREIITHPTFTEFGVNYWKINGMVVRYTRAAVSPPSNPCVNIYRKTINASKREYIKRYRLSSTSSNFKASGRLHVFLDRYISCYTIKPENIPLINEKKASHASYYSYNYPSDTVKTLWGNGGGKSYLPSTTTLGQDTITQIPSNDNPFRGLQSNPNSLNSPVFIAGIPMNNLTATKQFTYKIIIRKEVRKRGKGDSSLGNRIDIEGSNILDIEYKDKYEKFSLKDIASDVEEDIRAKSERLEKTKGAKIKNVKTSQITKTEDKKEKIIITVSYDQEIKACRCDSNAENVFAGKIFYGETYLIKRIKTVTTKTFGDKACREVTSRTNGDIPALDVVTSVQKFQHLSEITFDKCPDGHAEKAIRIQMA
jgi:hypothetical protein